MSWTAIIVLAAGAYLFKLVGVEGLGRLPAATRWVGVVGLLPAALLAGLIVTQTVGGPHRIVIDARLAGVAAGAALVATRRVPFIVVIAASALVTALVRAVS